MFFGMTSKVKLDLYYIMLHRSINFEGNYVPDTFKAVMLMKLVFQTSILELNFRVRISSIKY